MRYSKYKKGFSIIELMVAVSVFITVIVISSASFLSVLSSNKKTRALRDVMDAINFPVEEITRNLRTGTEYLCINNGTSNAETNLQLSGDKWVPGYASVVSANCGLGSGLHQGVSFFRQNPEDTHYRSAYWSNGSCIMKRDGTDGASPSSASCITDSDTVEIKRFQLISVGAGNEGAGAQRQPRIQLIIEGTAKTASGTFYETDFQVQTTITQRNLDL